MSGPIPAGQRNQLVTIQAPPAARDSRGGRTGDWTDVAQVWARKRSLNTRETMAAGTVEAGETAVFGINFRADVTADMRVLWRGVPFAIIGMPVDVDGDRHTLELTCASGGRDSQP